MVMVTKWLFLFLMSHVSHVSHWRVQFKCWRNIAWSLDKWPLCACFKRLFLQVDIKCVCLCVCVCVCVSCIVVCPWKYSPFFPVSRMVSASFEAKKRSTSTRKNKRTQKLQQQHKEQAQLLRREEGEKKKEITEQWIAHSYKEKLVHFTVFSLLQVCWRRSSDKEKKYKKRRKKWYA